VAKTAAPPSPLKQTLPPPHIAVLVLIGFAIITIDLFHYSASLPANKMLQCCHHCACNAIDHALPAGDVACCFLSQLVINFTELGRSSTALFLVALGPWNHSGIACHDNHYAMLVYLQSAVHLYPLVNLAQPSILPWGIKNNQ